VAASGWRKKTIEKVAGGKFIKAKWKVKWIGTITVPKEPDAERSHPLEVEEARLYKFQKSKSRGG
jgi:hypothetical protein